MIQVQSPTVVYVNPIDGDDGAIGDQGNPYKTMTRALQQAVAGCTIHLGAGIYSVESGEVFPAIVSAGVSVIGNIAGRGSGIVIEGGGDYDSPTFDRQCITLLLEDTAQLRGVTVTNPIVKGTGVWLESGIGTIANCTLRNCGREGVFVTGEANLAIVNSIFLENAASGISFVRHAKGEVRRSFFRRNGFGITISDYAAPLVIECQIMENRSGIVLSGMARPVLRGNFLERNTRDGVSVFNNALPDLGNPHYPAGNFSRENAEFDLRNSTSFVLLSVGNYLSPTRISGSVSFQMSQIVRDRPVSADRLHNGQTPPRASTLSSSPHLLPPLSPPPLDRPIPSQHWAAAFIRSLAERRVFSGLWDGSLKPELTVSRAQFAMLLTKALPLPTKRSSQGFQDVPANHWAAAAIAQADRMGFLSGFPDQTFRPEELLTRLDALVSLVNGLGLTGDNPSVLGVYRDRAQIPSFAIGAIAAATQHRLVMSYPWVDRLNPWARLTWAEVAVMLYQALVVTEQAIALPCPYIVNPQPNATFADIQGHWAAEFIRGLASQGLMDGLTEGQFEPDRPMMRSEYAELLVKGFNPAADRPAKFFADIPPDSEWADAIQQVYQGKLMGGFADNTFHPNRGITRVQVLLSLVNAIKFPAADLAILDRYQDAETIPASVRNVVATATTEWLVVNYPNLRELHPNQPATRAEIAAMVYQALVRLGRASAISSPYIIHPQQPNQKQPRDPNAALVVAIDPGHGGFDLGGIGLDGVREKDVTLPMAIDVADWLKRQNIQPILTRSGDYDLELATRVEIAENADADLFISLHANVNPNQPTLNGLELYHYAASTESARLAQAIHHSLVRSIEVRDRGIHHANFYTLRLPPMPSVLVEIGYLTGQQDAANLANATYRNYLAQAIAIGILRYVQQMRE